MSNDKFIKIPKFLIIVTGFWPFKLTDNALYTKIYKFYTKFQIVSYVCFVLSLVANLIILIVKHNQPTRIFSAMNIFICIFQNMMKISLFQLQKIPEMFFHVMENENAIAISQDEEIKEYYIKKVKHCRTMHICQLLINYCTALSFAVMYLLQVFQAEDTSIYQDQPFMLDMWYPFKRETHMCLVVLINIGIVIQGTTFTVTTQITFINLMTYASVRLHILQIRLRKFDKIVMESSNGDALHTIKKLVVEHQLVIRFVKLLNDRTKYVMLVDYVLNSVSLAAATIQLVVGDSGSDLMSVAFIVMMILLQIFLLGWSGNEISEQSLGVADAIWASKWNEQSDEVKKLFIIMLMRAQKPLGVTAGPFFMISLKSALTTVKVAYSYMSLMMQNYED